MTRLWLQTVTVPHISHKPVSRELTPAGTSAHSDFSLKVTVSEWPTRTKPLVRRTLPRMANPALLE
jgi:hypothetical protein